MLKEHVTTPANVLIDEGTPACRSTRDLSASSLPQRGAHLWPRMVLINRPQQLQQRQRSERRRRVQQAHEQRGEASLAERHCEARADADHAHQWPQQLDQRLSLIHRCAQRGRHFQHLRRTGAKLQSQLKQQS